jgi:hypothetical protein
VSTDTPGTTPGDDPVPDTSGTDDTESTEPTPGSDNDGAEAGYTPPAGSDDPVSD